MRVMGRVPPGERSDHEEGQAPGWDSGPPGAVREHARYWSELGARITEVRTPADLEAVDMLVLPGGESTTMSLLLETSGLLEPLRSRVRGGMPAFGTCAGMILLAAEVADGRPRPTPSWSHRHRRAT